MFVFFTYWIMGRLHAMHARTKARRRRGSLDLSTGCHVSRSLKAGARALPLPRRVTLLVDRRVVQPSLKANGGVLGYHLGNLSLLDACIPSNT